MITEKHDKDPKTRIMATCVQMFIEKGYKKTTMLDIIKEADVSAGTFQNIFKTKDGVLNELVDVMFEMQFSLSEKMIKDISNPVMLYALETSLQLTLVELNENIKEIYVEAYSHPETVDAINDKTYLELIKIFKNYLPNYEESDFYEIEIGTSGMMRSFMIKSCDQYFTLKKKIKRFLSMSLAIFHISIEKQNEIINTILQMDIVSIAKDLLNKLLTMLSMKYEIKFHNIIHE